MANAKEIIRERAKVFIATEHSFSSNSLEAGLIYHIADLLRRLDRGEVTYATMDIELHSAQAQLHALTVQHNAKTATEQVQEFILELQQLGTHANIRASLLRLTINRENGVIDEDTLLMMLDRARMAYLESMENSSY